MHFYLTGNVRGSPQGRDTAGEGLEPTVTVEGGNGVHRSVLEHVRTGLEMSDALGLLILVYVAIGFLFV